MLISQSARCIYLTIVTTLLLWEFRLLCYRLIMLAKLGINMQQDHMANGKAGCSYAFLYAKGGVG